MSRNACEHEKVIPDLHHLKGGDIWWAHMEAMSILHGAKASPSLTSSCK